MFTALLITILPTLLAFILLTKIGLKPKSIFLKLALSWFTGVYFFTFGTFFIAVLLTSVTTDVLIKATYAMLLIIQFSLLFFIKDVRQLLLALRHNIKIPTKKTFTGLFLAVFCLFFSYAFFTNQLSVANGYLATTPIYWDFHWQMSLVQNFIHGDNFPPQNEAFAGLSHTYHYFWMVHAAIYGAGGLDLAAAINTATVIGFFFILIALIGLGEELFHSRLAGFIAVLLAITSSSLRFIHYFQQNQNKSLSELVTGIVTNTAHPWNFSHIDFGDIYYNGTMYNLFYILQERQMITGVVFLLLSLWILYERNRLGTKTLVVIGALMGGFFLWHLQITLMILAALMFLLIFDKHKKKTLYMLGGFLVVFTMHYLFFKNLTQSEWFIHTIGNYPAFNPGFSDQEHEAFSFSHALQWYFYSYGLKLILVPIGIVYLWKKNKHIAIVVAAILIPTFLLINTIQLNPPSVYENHKWLRPMNFVADFMAAYIIFVAFFMKKRFVLKSVGVLCLFFLTISGILEHVPYINSKPTTVIATYDSPLVLAIRTKTPPQSVFVSSHNTEVYLAGRKLFLANNLRGHDDLVLDKKRRQEIIQSIYHADSIAAFCHHAKTNNIDFVDFNKSTISPLKETVRSLPHFAAPNSNNDQVIFVNVKKTCL